MAYNEFAYFYDEFNGEADYDVRDRKLRRKNGRKNRGKLVRVWVWERKEGKRWSVKLCWRGAANRGRVAF